MLVKFLALWDPDFFLSIIRLDWLLFLLYLFFVVISWFAFCFWEWWRRGKGTLGGLVDGLVETRMDTEDCLILAGNGR